jgi:hypothetical protein
MAEQWVRLRLARGETLSRDILLAERVTARYGLLAERPPCPTPPPDPKPAKRAKRDDLDLITAIKDLLNRHMPNGLPTHKIQRALRDSAQGLRKKKLLALLSQGPFTPNFSSQEHKARTPVYWTIASKSKSPSP